MAWVTGPVIAGVVIAGAAAGAPGAIRPMDPRVVKLTGHIMDLGAMMMMGVGLSQTGSRHQRQPMRKTFLSTATWEAMLI